MKGEARMAPASRATCRSRLSASMGCVITSFLPICRQRLPGENRQAAGKKRRRSPFPRPGRWRSGRCACAALPGAPSGSCPGRSARSLTAARALPMASVASTMLGYGLRRVGVWMRLGFRLRGGVRQRKRLFPRRCSPRQQQPLRAATQLFLRSLVPSVPVFPFPVP